MVEYLLREGCHANETFHHPQFGQTTAWLLWTERMQHEPSLDPEAKIQITNLFLTVSPNRHLIIASARGKIDILLPVLRLHLCSCPDCMSGAEQEHFRKRGLETLRDSFGHGAVESRSGFGSLGVEDLGAVSA